MEQENFVKCGKELFEDKKLKFHFSIEDCLKRGDSPDTILLSGVLAYIEKPYELLEKIFDLNFTYILIDRTSFSMSGDECIMIQKVSPDIYNASFPCWFFDFEKFKHFFSLKYELIEEFDSFDKVNYPSVFKGFIFERKEQ